MALYFPWISHPYIHLGHGDTKCITTTQKDMQTSPSPFQRSSHALLMLNTSHWTDEMKWNDFSLIFFFKIPGNQSCHTFSLHQILNFIAAFLLHLCIYLPAIYLTVHKCTQTWSSSCLVLSSTINPYQWSIQQNMWRWRLVKTQ